MLILFEDDANTPSSKLLLSSYFGASIRFSSGVGRLAKLIEDSLKVDSVLAFVDVSPNRATTMSAYNHLCSNFDNEIMSGSLILVPIPCIEYIILKMLTDYSYIDVSRLGYVNKLITNLDYSSKEVQDFILRNSGVTVSFEHLLKAVLSNVAIDLKSPCLRNVTASSKHHVSGKFYVGDCACDRIYCRVASSDAVSVKSERLYTALPLFFVDGKAHRSYLRSLGLLTKDCIVADKFCKMQSFYNDLSDQLKSNRFKLVYKP